MATPNHHLFSDLPPELRNDIYNHISAPSAGTQPTTTGLPLKLKTFSCRHTSVQMCPVHYGSTSLIELKDDFVEGKEYYSHLIQNCIELKIGVNFHGRVNTFVQQDWNRKIETHLRKLVKKNPWLSKVARYDIQIYWSPMDGVLKSSKRNKRVASQIPMDMLKTLTSFMDPNVKDKKGNIKLDLRIASCVSDWEKERTEFGWQHLLSEAEETGASVPTSAISVFVEAKKVTLEPTFSSPLIVVPKFEAEDRSLLTIDGGVVSWIQLKDVRRALVIAKRMDRVKLDKPTPEGYGFRLGIETFVEPWLV